MIASVGTPVRHKKTKKEGRVISGNAGWIGVTTTMVKYKDGGEEEVEDGHLEIIVDQSFVNLRCPTCKTVTPHSTVGVKRDDLGVYQEMKCAVAACGTLTKVYGGKEGEEFQDNVDAPDGM